MHAVTSGRFRKKDTYAYGPYKSLAPGATKTWPALSIISFVACSSIWNNDALSFTDLHGFAAGKRQGQPRGFVNHCEELDPAVHVNRTE